MGKTANILKRIDYAKKNRKKIVHITDKSNLSIEDRMKLGLCRHFVQFAYIKRMSVKELAKLLGLPMSRVSEIINYKINNFKVDKLIHNLTLLAKHDKNVYAHLELIEQVVELPTLNVKDINQLTNQVKSVSRSAFAESQL